MTAPRRGPWVAALLMTAAAALSPAAAPRPAGTAELAPIVYVADVDSVIHPVSAEYMIHTMDRADAAGAALVVFTLRTPGGLLDATRDIVTRMLASRTPIAIFTISSTTTPDTSANTTSICCR
jgi:membrane-bound serine protease (ClpP class)